MVERMRGGTGRRRIELVLVVLVLAGLGWWLFGRHGGSARHEPAGAADESSGQTSTHRQKGHHGAGHGGQAAAQSVGTAQIGRGDIRVLLNGLGAVTPLANITVRTQINGQLQRVGFLEGQIVKAGDFLAQIDPRPYQVALEQAEGALERDQALLQEARLDLARYRKLLSQDSIARQQVDTQASLVMQDEGNVRTDQGQIDSAKLNLVYCHITAPVTGRVGLRQVDAGNYVQTSDANGLVVLTQLDPISVVFSLPEDDLPQIEAQTRLGRTLPVLAFDRSDANQIATGELETTDNVVDTTTGTVKLRAIFYNPQYRLFPNQFVNAHLLVDTHRNVVVMPGAAVQRGEPGTFAYVVQPDHSVTVRKLVLGPQDGDRVEVQSGLADNDIVVTDGADRLREGAKVRVAKAGAPPGAPSGVPSGAPAQPDQSAP